MPIQKHKPGKGASGKSRAPDQVKPPIMTPPIEGSSTLLSNAWQKYFDELSRIQGVTGIAGTAGANGTVGATGIEGTTVQGATGIQGEKPSSNIDGGFPSSTYLPDQVIDGGTP